MVSFQSSETYSLLFRYFTHRQALSSHCFLCTPKAERHRLNLFIVSFRLFVCLFDCLFFPLLLFFFFIRSSYDFFSMQISKCLLRCRVFSNTSGLKAILNHINRVFNFGGAFISLLEPLFADQVRSKKIYNSSATRCMYTENVFTSVTLSEIIRI